MNVFKLTARSEKSTMKKSYLEMSEVCTFFPFQFFRQHQSACCRAIVVSYCPYVKRDY